MPAHGGARSEPEERDGTDKATDADKRALRPGGTISTLLGRWGNVPPPGSGLHAGPLGAFAVAGDGVHLTRALLASRASRMLESGSTSAVARDAATAMSPDTATWVPPSPGERRGWAGRTATWRGRG